LPKAACAFFSAAFRSSRFPTAHSTELNPAVLRQRMGHSSSAMTARYTGEIPIEQVRAGFSMKLGNQIVVLESMENEVAA
jgi:acetyl/propionyl-CoA carboxylase alpha subunit